MDVLGLDDYYMLCTIFMWLAADPLYVRPCLGGWEEGNRRIGLDENNQACGSDICWGKGKCKLEVRVRMGMQIIKLWRKVEWLVKAEVVGFRSIRVVRSGWLNVYRVKCLLSRKVAGYRLGRAIHTYEWRQIWNNWFAQNIPSNTPPLLNSPELVPRLVWRITRLQCTRSIITPTERWRWWWWWGWMSKGAVVLSGDVGGGRMWW